MHIGDALLAQILAEPDEDTPRLVYADWLEEQGRAERAEFIRVQVELTRRPTLALKARERVLFARHGRHWLAPLKAVGEPLHGDAHGEFRRGFVEVVWMTASRFLERADRLLSLTPVRELRVTHLKPGELEKLLGSSGFTRLRVLDVSDRRLGDSGVLPLARSQQVRGLRVLRLRGCGLQHSGAIALAGSKHLSGLERLDVSHNMLTPAAYDALLQAFGDRLIAEGVFPRDKHE